MVLVLLCMLALGRGSWVRSGDGRLQDGGLVATLLSIAVDYGKDQKERERERIWASHGDMDVHDVISRAVDSRLAEGRPAGDRLFQGGGHLNGRAHEPHDGKTHRNTATPHPPERLPVTPQ